MSGAQQKQADDILRWLQGGLAVKQLLKRHVDVNVENCSILTVGSLRCVCGQSRESHYINKELLQVLKWTKLEQSEISLHVSFD